MVIIEPKEVENFKMEDNTVVKTNFQKIKNANSVEEVAQHLSSVISTSFVEISDSNATIVFRNGSATVVFDWNEANKDFLTTIIKNWLESENNKIEPVEPTKETKECVNSQ